MSKYDIPFSATLGTANTWTTVATVTAHTNRTLRAAIIELTDELAAATDRGIRFRIRSADSITTAGAGATAPTIINRGGAAAPGFTALTGYTGNPVLNAGSLLQITAERAICAGGGGYQEFTDSELECKVFGSRVLELQANCATVKTTPLTGVFTVSE